MQVSHLDAADAFVTLDGSFFTAGMAHLRVGDEYRDVRAGECVVIPPGAVHKLTNTGEAPLTLLCCCAPACSNDDTVLQVR